MTSGILFALAIAALAGAVIFGLVRRNKMAGVGGRDDVDGPSTVAHWTEGETTRLLSSAELPGLYLVRPRFLSKAEGVVYLLLRAAFPRHEIFARVRLSDVLQVKIGPQGMDAWLSGFAQLHAAGPGAVARAGERPRGALVARWQAPRREAVTNLRHETIRLVDPFARTLLPLCDGTRDRAGLAAALGDAQPGGDPALRARIEETLATLAQCALLES